MVRGRGGLFPLKICKYKTSVTLGVFGENMLLDILVDFSHQTVEEVFGNMEDFNGE